MIDSEQSPDDPIDAREAQEHASFIRRMATTDDPAAQRKIAGEALLRFGLRFSWAVSYAITIADDDMKPTFQHIDEVVQSLYTDWIVGERLSDREDEDERRAAAALQMLQHGEPRLARIAAEALLELPPDHPRRNAIDIRAVLQEQLALRRKEGQWEDLFLVAQTLFRSDLLNDAESDALITDIHRGLTEARAADAPIDATYLATFLRAAGLDYYRRAVAAREDRDRDPQPLIAAAVPLLEEARAIGTTPHDDLAFAVVLDELDQPERAADLLSPLVDARSKMYEEASWIEGMLRLRLGHFSRAIDVLAPLIDAEEREYLLAIEDSEVQSAGDRFSKDAVNLAFAYAYANRWPEALATLDRVKSPRLQHARRLRQTPEGKDLLRLEAELASARRGAPVVITEDVDRELDPLGARITHQATLLERYRLKRPDLASAALQPPSLADLSSALAPGEALVCLGDGFRGTMIGVILNGDGDAPSEAVIIEDTPSVFELFGAGEEITGWALELVVFAPVDPEPALDAMLDSVDRIIGQPIAELLRKHNVRRASIVPHRMLHLIPFWALPSLRDVDVTVASSAAQWYEASKVVPTVPARLAAIGNPTLDLGLARVEAASVARQLAHRGYSSTVLLDRDATESAILASVRDAGVFHFAGHGLAKSAQPLLSGLLAHPDQRWGWPAAGDPLAKLANAATDWVDTDGGRRTDTPQGRLIETTTEEGSVVERYLEYAEQGTLFGGYDDGTLMQLAELWTTADVLIADAFSSCGIAFLGACESGRTAFRVDIDESLGLPGALQTAGVHTVISTLWPITDTGALLFAVLFYQRLAASVSGEFNVADAVRACRRELSELSREDATAMLTELELQTDHKPSKARLRFAVQDLLDMDEQPFASPYHWAAYFSLGAEKVRLA